MCPWLYQFLYLNQCKLILKYNILIHVYTNLTTNIASKFYWGVEHRIIHCASDGSGSARFTGPPIDCGLIIISYRGAGTPGGGVLYGGTGYFTGSRLAVSTHNSAPELTLSGNTGNFTVNIPANSAYKSADVHVSLFYPAMSYDTAPVTN